MASLGANDQVRHLLFILPMALACFCHHANQAGQARPIVNISLDKPVENLDPVKSVDVATGTILSLLHRGLYQATHNGSIVPDLVDKEKISHKTLQLWLKNARFQNGRAVTAADVAFSLNRLKRSGRQGWVTESIDSVSAVRGRVVIRFKNPTREILSTQRALLSMPQCVIYNEWAFRRDGSIVPAGPFKVSQNSDEQLLLEADDLAVRFRVLQDETSRWFFFKNQLVDIYEATGIYRFLPYDESRYKTSEVDHLTVLYAAIVKPTDRKSHLSRVAFRQWLNYKLDRHSLTEKVLLGAYRATDHPVPPSLAKPLSVLYDYRPGAGYQVRFEEKIDIFSPPDRERRLVARTLADMIRKQGLAARVSVFDLPTLIRFNNQGRPGIYVFKWVADYPHASNFLLPLFHSANAGRGGNRAHLKNSSVDAMIAEALQSENYQELQQKIRSLAPWVFIGFSRQKYFIRKDLAFSAPVSYTAWSKQLFSSSRPGKK